MRNFRRLVLLIKSRMRPQQLQKNTKRNVCLMIAAGMVFGCSTVGYEEPTRGATAAVRFSSNATDVVVVFRYKDSDCTGETEWMRLRKGFLLNSSPKSLGIPLAENLHPNAYKEFRVLADTDHVFLFKGQTNTAFRVNTCAVPVKANFRAGGKYEINYDYGVTECAVEVNEILRTDSASSRKKKIDTFSYIASGFGEGCMDAFKQVRLY